MKAPITLGRMSFLRRSSTRRLRGATARCAFLGRPSTRGKLLKDHPLLRSMLATNNGRLWGSRASRTLTHRSRFRLSTNTTSRRAWLTGRNSTGTLLLFLLLGVPLLEEGLAADSSSLAERIPSCMTERRPLITSPAPQQNGKASFDSFNPKFSSLSSTSIRPA